MRRALRSLAALGAVAFILIGWPWLLATAALGPLRGYLPNLSDPLLVAQHPDAAGLLLGAVLALAVGAWVVTAGALVVELVVQAAGLPAPHLGARLGGLVPQASMSRLAATALIILPVGGQLAGSPASATTHGTAQLARGSEVAATAMSDGPTTRDCAPESAAPASSRYVVKAGDTLWGVARAKLGAGERFPEVYRASARIRQPDGRRLRDPDVILPGWRLQIPEDRDSAAECPPTERQVPRGGPVPPTAIDRGRSAAGNPTRPTSPPGEIDRGTSTPAASPKASSTPTPSTSVTGVRLLQVGPDSATLTWDGFAGAIGYLVAVGDTSMQVPGTTIALRGLAPSTDYVVAVRAVMASGGWGTPGELKLRTIEHPGSRPTPPGAAARGPLRTADPMALLELRRPGSSAPALLRGAGPLPGRSRDAGSCLAQMARASGIDLVVAVSTGVDDVST